MARAIATVQTGGRLLIASPTGSGKSLILNAIHSRLPAGGVVLAPSLDILEGLFAKAYGAIEDRAHMESAGYWTVKTYHNRLMEAAVPLPKWLLVDECFPAGTQVDGRPIESIRAGEWVTAFGGPRKVLRIIENLCPSRMVRLEYKGRVLHCTPNHPFQTRRGMINAERLLVSDSLLQYVSRGVYPDGESVTRLESGPEGLLLPGVQECTAIEENGRDEPTACVSPHASAQSYAPGRESGEGVQDAKSNGAQTRDTGRQRPGLGVRGSVDGGNGAQGGSRENVAEERLWVSVPLQAGPARTGGEAGDRNRWGEPLCVEGTSQGPQEGVFASWVRLDNVTLLQRGRSPEFDSVCPDGKVYNLHIEGCHTYFAGGLGVHNCHHSLAETYVTLHALAGNCPMVGVTATPYRGTPEQTAALRALWGEPFIALTLVDAVRQSIIAKPAFSVWPLLDDDTIAVQNGDFVTTAVEVALEDKYDCIADRIRSLPRRPTMVRCPGVASARRMTEALESAICITGETSPADRREAFRRASAGEAILVQVKVIGEGVDLPLRRLIDLAPTMSPVAWMQAVGRITRPTEETPEYITCCHNLTRHAYLWAGLIPASQIAAAQRAWGDKKLKRRSMARAIGLEGFGRFTVSPVPMADGTYGSLYSLQTSDGLHQYAVFLHACQAEPLYFERSNAQTGRTLTNADGREYTEKAFGRWRRIAAIPSAEGYLSCPVGRMTDKMRSIWTQKALTCGLDVDTIPDARVFQTLFIFLNTRTVYAC